MSQIRSAETSAVSTLSPLTYAHYNRLVEELDTARHQQTRIQHDCLTDPYTLFLMHKIIQADGIRLSELDEIIANSKGWARAIRLVTGGLAELAGEFLYPTPEGRSLHSQAERIFHTPDE